MKRCYDVVVKIKKFFTKSEDGIEITDELGETYTEYDQYTVEPITLLVHTTCESFDEAKIIALDTIQKHLGLSDEKMEEVDIVLVSDTSKATVTLSTFIDIQQRG